MINFLHHHSHQPVVSWIHKMDATPCVMVYKLSFYVTESLFHSGTRKPAAAYKIPEDSTDSLFVLDDGTEHASKGETIPVEDNSDLLRY